MFGLIRKVSTPLAAGATTPGTACAPAPGATTPSAMPTPSLTCATTPGAGGSVLLAAWRMLTGLITYVLFGVVLGSLFTAALPADYVGAILQSGVASIERVFELLDAEDEPADDGLAETPTVSHGRVAFDDVSFRYLEDQPLIEHVTFHVDPGQTVAIVGPTGAGKTTLVNLIMRFYDLDSGRITLDGIDIATMRRDDLRHQTGMVLQDTWLFEGTIRDNIAYGRLDATDDEIMAAARATYVDRFVGALPDGYDTIVDDDGGRISAGEKQLITIARAFLADPALLILDEATRSVDTRTEVLVQHAMSALRADRTSFVIAHRLSTIRDADLILVMEDGRIVEQGNHRELLELAGSYARLYESQFTGPEIALDDQPEDPDGASL